MAKLTSFYGRHSCADDFAFLCAHKLGLSTACGGPLHELMWLTWPSHSEWPTTIEVVELLWNELSLSWLIFSAAKCTQQHNRDFPHHFACYFLDWKIRRQSNAPKHLFKISVAHCSSMFMERESTQKIWRGPKIFWWTGPKCLCGSSLLMMKGMRSGGDARTTTITRHARH